jgi:hypothetical protein
MTQKFRQRGQALTEVLVGFVVIGLFLLGAHHMWRYAEAQQAAVEAVRFAAWERVVWEPSDNSVEKHALHKSDAALAAATVLHQLSTPLALRKYRESLSANGDPAPAAIADRRSWLSAALRSFVDPGQDPAKLVTVSTSSGWTNEAEHWIRGRDPTFNTTTSLSLDQDTYRTVTLTLNSQLTALNPMRLFDFALSPLQTTKKLALITNTWAASPPMMRVRTVRQLLPFSSGDEISGTKANPLAYFGLDNSTGGTSAGDFVGMVPWWNFVGGANGMGGQYVVRQIGLDANGANTLMQSAGKSFTFNPADPAGSVLLKAQVYQNDYFDPNYARSMQHRHESVIDTTAEQVAEDADGPKSRNANSGKRKYRALSLQNPVETYFAE